MSTQLKQLFTQFNKLKVLIVGDVMIDSYVFGNVQRISPEAPVPIVAIEKKEQRLGGAANVALNIQAMGATPILCSVVGNDENSKDFFNILQKQKILSKGIIKSNNRITTVKTRIIGNNHQMLRIDEETTKPIPNNESVELATFIRNEIKKNNVSAIIFEDYDKGVITPDLITEIVDFANKYQIPTVVDPKKNNFLHYKNVTLFKPNLKELREGLKIDFNTTNKSELNSIIGKFMTDQNIKNALVTLSDKGMFFKNKQINFLVPAHVRDIADVSGAGDTVISLAALGVALQLDPKITTALANLAGGLVCEKTGVVPIDKDTLLNEAIKLKLKV